MNNEPEQTPAATSETPAPVVASGTPAPAPAPAPAPTQQPIQQPVVSTPVATSEVSDKIIENTRRSICVVAIFFIVVSVINILLTLSKSFTVREILSPILYLITPIISMIWVKKLKKISEPDEANKIVVSSIILSIVQIVGIVIITGKFKLYPIISTALLIYLIVQWVRLNKIVKAKRLNV